MIPYSRCVSGTAACVVCCALFAGASVGRKSETTVPLSAAVWTADMHGYGYRDEDLDLQRARVGLFLGDTSFISDNELVETFATRAPTHGLQRRGDPQRVKPFGLQAVFLDAASGHPLHQLTWASDYRKVGLIARDEGRFAVFLGDRLEFYSHDFALEKTIELNPPLTSDDGIKGFSASPSGRTMLIEYGGAKPTVCVVVVDDSLAAVLATCGLPMRTVTSDDEFAAFTPTPDGDGGNVLIEMFKGPWRPLCENWECNDPEFVSEDRLLVWSSAGLMLLRNDGKRIFETWYRLPHGAMWVRGYSEKRGLLAFQFFGDAEDANNPSVRPFAGVMVYDVSMTPPDPQYQNRPGAQAPFLIFQVKNGGKNRIHTLRGLAISPSGDRLALEGEGMLRVFKLPARAWWQ